MLSQTMRDMYRRASQVLPGGVTANARTNSALGQPFYVARADGPFVYDLDERSYLDLCMSNGATLLGHGHSAVTAAVQRALAAGVGCAYDGEAQVRLAERLVEQIPSFEQVRFTTTGTEATFYAVRTARVYTGRSRVLKFEGHFHGYNDALAFNFWPSQPDDVQGQLLTPRPESGGMPEATADDIIVVPFNDVAAFEVAIARYGDELAAVLMEPINYDSGAIMPDRAFLQAVREETARRGIVLIFDEILSAYRTGPDCAQGYLGVTPDLTLIGKAIGGGLPLSVFGGRRDIMSVVAPLGPAVHTGTYNANLVAIAAAHAFLDQISQPDFYPRLLRLSDQLGHGLRQAFAAADVPVRVQWVGARMGMFFGLDPQTEVTTYAQASRMDRGMLDAFCAEMVQRGMFVTPTWHHGLSAAHDETHVQQFIEAASASASSPL